MWLLMLLLLLNILDKLPIVCANEEFCLIKHEHDILSVDALYHLWETVEEADSHWAMDFMCDTHLSTDREKKFDRPVLLRKFIKNDKADWWMNGGSLNPEPFKNDDEYLYKRMYVRDDDPLKYGTESTDKLQKVRSDVLKEVISTLFPDIWIRHKIKKGTTNYQQSPDVDIEFVQLDYKWEKESAAIKMTSKEGGIQWKSIAKTDKQITDRIKQKLIDSGVDVDEMKYELNKDEIKYFSQYQKFLNNLLTAVKNKQPFLWIGYDPKKDETKYYYHPNYVRYYKQLYWLLYSISNDGTVRMPLWTGENHLEGRKELVAVDANKGKFKVKSPLDKDGITISVSLIIKDEYDLTIKVEESSKKGNNKQVDKLDIHWEPQFRHSCAIHTLNALLGSRGMYLYIIIIHRYMSMGTILN